MRKEYTALTNIAVGSRVILNEEDGYVYVDPESECGRCPKCDLPMSISRYNHIIHNKEKINL